MAATMTARADGEVRRLRALLAAGFVAAAAWLAAGPAAGSVWCGENGLVRFSFAEGDSLVETLQTGDPQGGVTVVDVWAWLDGMDDVARDGDAFLRVGGVELKLQVTGAEASVIEQDFFDPGAVSIGPAPGIVAAGFRPGVRVRDGRALLVHWKLLFQGRPENVRLGLDAAGTRSCATITGCPGSGTQALYVGADVANQLDCLFGAGYAPAWINPSGEPDRTPVTGTVGWREAGVFQAR